jgi:hypothetical protein
VLGLTGRALKVTIVLAAAEVLAYPEPDTPRVMLRIRVPDRTVTADIAAKSLRRAQATIREVGPEGVAVILQGKLAANDEIVEAGLSAQVKIVKPSSEAPV